MARLLVTGGAGFIGANFVHYWLAHHPGDRLVVLDALTYAGRRASLAEADDNPAFRFVHGDINDQALVEDLMAIEVIDTIVHFAAESHVDRSIHGPDAFVRTNIVGTHAMLAAARRVWLAGSGRPHRFHHVSTDEVYGSLTPEQPPFCETTPYAPNSPYAASKAAADHLVRSYHHTYGMSTTISNCSNNYGPFQFPEKLIPLMLLKMLAGQPLPLYGDGLQVRDWLFVEDHCRGIELVLAQGLSGEVYNIGGCNEWNNLAVVRCLGKLLHEMFEADPSLAVRFPSMPTAHGGHPENLLTLVTDRPGHDRRYAIDAGKISTELGYQPLMTFVDGLRRTVQWYLAHESWWRAIQDDAYQKWLTVQYG